MAFVFKQTFPLYDPPEVLEPVIEELIASTPMQRLENVHQLGTFFLLNPAWGTTRLEHSIGTMLLLRRAHASLEEQIAGLLHDASHFAFSHVVDFVFEHPEENFADAFQDATVGEGEIAEILRRYGFDPVRIADTKSFPLLEQNKPELCADRIDYSLRDAMTFGYITLQEAQDFLQALSLKDGWWTFQDQVRASRFAHLYLQLDRQYRHPEGVVSYFLLAEAIRAGLQEQLITFEDLSLDDMSLLEKLQMGSDAVLRPLQRIGPNLRVVEDPDQYDFVSTKKIRYADPRVGTDHGPIPVSQCDAAVDKAIHEHINRFSKPHYYRIDG